eukprot:14460.XXX_477197_478462_1 [CDS] Oithona nana genome sequencing.
MSPTKLRIKIDHDGRLKWMFCDLRRLKSIKCLKEQIKEKYDLDKFNLLLDDAILPKREPIDLLNNGDTVQIDDDFKDSKPADKAKKNSSLRLNGKVNGMKANKKSSADEDSATESSVSEAKSSSSESSSSSNSASSSSSKDEPKKKTEMSKDSSADDDEVETFEKSFNHVEYNPKLPEKTNEDKPAVPQVPVPQVSEVEFVPKRKRHRKNKNKNKLATDANASPIVPKSVTNPATSSNFSSQGKIIKFADNDDEEGEPENKRYAASSPAVSCEDMLLKSAQDIPKRKAPSPIKAVVSPMNHEHGNPTTNGGGLDALLKLKDNPLKAKKRAQKDVCHNQSVVLTNPKTTNPDFDLDKIQEYQCFDGDPEVGQILAFKCLQVSPVDYTPQMIQYVGEFKSKEDDQVTFLLLHDETECLSRSDKF